MPESHPAAAAAAAPRDDGCQRGGRGRRRRECRRPRPRRRSTRRRAAAGLSLLLAAASAAGLLLFVARADPSAAAATAAAATTEAETETETEMEIEEEEERREDARAEEPRRVLVEAAGVGAAAGLGRGALRKKGGSGSPSTDASSSSSLSTSQIFSNALKRAVGGGLPGAAAGVVQVLTLMWLRTVINFQYRYGQTFVRALSALWNEGVATATATKGVGGNGLGFWGLARGGVGRLYSGVGFALIQAPLTRFVSTAANDGVASLVRSFRLTERWGPGREVFLAAMLVGIARTTLMPIDTCKTVLQIEGAAGFQALMSRVRREGKFQLLYSGALASALSSFVGHYPWFYTYNTLSRSGVLERYVRSALVRNASIGFVSSIVSDVTANSLRVIKTTKQALGVKRAAVTYAETINVILAADGWRGLFGRGLKTRIFANALQSIVFTVIWRGLAERWKTNDDDGNGNGAGGTKNGKNENEDVAATGDESESSIAEEAYDDGSESEAEARTN